MSARSLRLGFAGTPAFAAVSLRALLEQAHHRLLAVYTQPDRPAGRGRQPRPSAVKELALAAGLPVHQPTGFADPAQVQALRLLELDALVVVAYGLILPETVLGCPRLGCLNVHASLLPRWRGAAPIQRAILAGDPLTGVSIMRVSRELDSGPVYRQARCPIEAGDTAATLEARLAELGARELLLTLDQLAEDGPEPSPQPLAGVTYAHKLNKTEALIDWRAPAQDIERRVRAFVPWPVAWTDLLEAPLRVWECRCEPAPRPAAPGTVLEAGAAGILVAAGRDAVRLQRVQLPGKRPVAAGELAHSHPALRALRERPAP